ncbi:hypothetical protein MUP59_10475 [Candidatus Bathyarchaeota archaeon]|nr:hypothetical protein [Candidatus Bathyarchaeota archaeon]
MRKKSSHDFILGYTDTETVKLDFDNMGFQEVLRWAKRTSKRFKLGGFVILRSSENHFHVIFNRTVDWTRNVSVMAWACLMIRCKCMIKWFIMQCIKEGSTLRVSPKKEKPIPRVICRYGDQDQEIKNFMHYREVVKAIMARFQPGGGSG